MSTLARFSWPTILKAVGIIIGITVVYAFLVPVVATLALKLGHTGYVSGNEIYRWLYWIIAWVLTIWQGSYMLRKVHDQIIDDMLVTAVVAALLLLVVKFVVWIVYEPINSDGGRLFAITPIDVGGALILPVVALIAARINKF